MTRALRIPFLALSLLLMALLALPASRAMAQDREIEIETFHEELDQYGRWFEHPRYGYVWSPDVDDRWRPYTRGQWVFTDEHGWYWQSEEPFGWAVYHYGRWFLDDDSGWVWVPGTEWAPAWVAWRNSDEQVGWAPLPPEAEWRGDALNFSARYYDTPRYTAAWCFVPVALLTSVAIYRHVAPAARNGYFVRQTSWVPSHRSVNRRIYNVGFDRQRYERITRRPIASVRIVDSARPVTYGARLPVGRGGEIQVYRPRFIAPTAVRPPPRLGEPPRRDGRGFVPPQGSPGGPVNPDLSRRRPFDGRQPQQPATLPPTQQQPAGAPPPPQQPVKVPPVQRPITQQPPVTQQPTTVLPPQRQGTPPPTQQPPPTQRTQVPPQGQQGGPPPGRGQGAPPAQQGGAPRGEKGGQGDPRRKQPQPGEQPAQTQPQTR